MYLDILDYPQVNINTWAIVGLYLLLIAILFNVYDIFLKAKSLFKKSEEVQNYITTEAKLKAIELNINGIINCDSEGRILTWNKGACKIFGWEEYQVAGKCLSIILPESAKAAYKQSLYEYRDTGFSEVYGKPVKLIAIDKDKKEIHVEINISQWRNENHLFFTAIVIDTTEQKKLERELDKLLDLYKEAENIEKYGAWKWNLITDEVFTTQGFRDIYEISIGKESYNDSMSRIHYEDKSLVEEKIKNGIRNRADYSMTYRIIGRNGKIKFVNNKARVWVGESGVEKIYGIIHEIEE